MRDQLAKNAFADQAQTRAQITVTLLQRRQRSRIMPLSAAGIETRREHGEARRRGPQKIQSGQDAALHESYDVIGEIVCC